jgi:Fe-S cluster assembly protein SufD
VTTTLTRNETTAPPEGGPSAEVVRAVAERYGDPDWVRDLRAQGWDAWLDIPLPSLRTEGWRRSELRWLDLPRFAPASLAAPPLPAVERLEELPASLLEQLQTSVEESGLLVEQDGSPRYHALGEEARRQGVIFTDLHTAFREHRDLVEPHLMRLLPPRWVPGEPSNAGKFEALNAALFGGGTFVYVPPDTTVALPLRSIFWAASQDGAFFPRSLIVVDRGAHLTYVDEYRSAPAASGSPLTHGSGATEIYVKDGARLDYVSTQEWAQTTGGFLTTRCSLGADAYVNWVLVGLGGQVSRTTADVIANGKGTRADLLGLAFGEGTQVFDVHTLQDHSSAFTDTDQMYKTALRDRSRVAYEGLIEIRKGSYGSNGYQANKNLLLDDTAKAESLPMLKINDNDVRCTHSSSVGPVEEEHVVYLMSRGLPRPIAERILVQGFFEPVIERIKVPEIRERIRDAVDRRIGDR